MYTKKIKDGYIVKVLG